MNQSRKAVRAMVEGAIFVALAEILGYLKLWHMPEGGSISLMMLPIIIFALRWGVGQGLLAGLALGILDFMLSGGIAIGWQSILGDYVIALTLLGLAGVGRKKGLPGILLGSILASLGRFVPPAGQSLSDPAGQGLWGGKAPGILPPGHGKNLPKPSR